MAARSARTVVVPARGPCWVSADRDHADSLVIARGDDRLRISINEAAAVSDSKARVTIEKGDAKSILGTGDKIAFHVIVGVFNLLAGPYLCVATEVAPVASTPDGDSFMLIHKTTTIPLSMSSAARLDHVMKADEKRFLAMIHKVTHSKTLLYSPRYHITHTQQRIVTEIATAEHKDEQQWSLADKRFFWNNEITREFQTPALGDWVTVVMSGFVEEQSANLDGHEFRYMLISRRSCERQGTRFVSRGIDANGSVSNYVESEQLCVFPDGHLTSYVQIRGSVPLFWQQLATLKYTPKIEMTATEDDQLAAFTNHFRHQVSLYGDVICVNLIDMKKDQNLLGSLFRQYIGRLNHAQVKYHWFDFHHECRNMKWGNLAKLVEVVKGDFTRLGYFSTDSTRTTPLTTQKGVLRTNCIDNLDRTNVVQSLFARRSILQQFSKPSDNVLESGFPAFEKIFKNVWANNADMVSILYSGTGALKTDFTRTGKRTKQGAIQDGINSLHRYYLNNFADGDTQDAIDLFLGKFEPRALYVKGQEDRYPSPWTGRIFSPSSPYFIVKLLFIIITLILVLCTKFSLKKWSGRRFVSTPRFVSHHSRPVVPTACPPAGMAE